jgi:hypothetical protein
MAYFDIALKPRELRKRAILAKQIFDLAGIKVDSVAGIGTSGIIALGIFAEVFDANIVAVRKEGESSHSHSPCTMHSDNSFIGNYIIIDDFICTGDTVRNIQDRIGKHNDDYLVSPVDLVGMVFYEGTLNGHIGKDEFRDNKCLRIGLGKEDTILSCNFPMENYHELTNMFEDKEIFHLDFVATKTGIQV